MPQLLGFGSKLITERKLNALTRRDLSDLIARACGRLAAARSPDDARPFEQIGLGRPLGVEIAYVYTGALGKSFFVRYDLMLASSVKRLPVFDAAPRAINALVKDVEPGFRFAHLAATQAGTPIVYYSPAMTDRGMAVTIEMA